MTWLKPLLSLLAAAFGLPRLLSDWLARRAAKKEQHTEDENAALRTENDALRRMEETPRPDADAVRDRLRHGEF